VSVASDPVSSRQSAGAAAVLVLQHVSKRYSRRGPAAVADVSLALLPGTVTAVVGPNGSGKTTLMRLIAGVTPPTEGTVRCRARSIGYVPERFPRTVPFTPLRYLEHLGRIRGLAPGPLEAEIDRLFLRFGLWPFATVRLPTLSKGARQKVAIAQALVGAPGLLILDEPWSGLDAPAQEALTRSILEVAAAGGAVVVTDHRESVVDATADRICRLDLGELVADDLVARRRDAVVLIEVDCADPAGAAPGVEPLHGVLGVRPDHHGLRIRATHAASNDLLRALLERGFWIRRVERVGADVDLEAWLADADADGTAAAAGDADAASSAAGEGGTGKGAGGP
jgi:ABC-type multidrug transport system ATPase subunit